MICIHGSTTTRPSPGHLHRNGHERCVERGQRQLERLGAVVGQPRRVCGSAGRGLDHVCSDWASQGLGVFVDDIVVSTGEGSTSFEAGLDGWAAGAPPGSATNANDWIRTTAAGFPVGAAITTPRTIIMGFGVEGISTPAERNAVMGRAMEYLLP